MKKRKGDIIMRKVTYLAVFEPTGNDDGYSVYFPDLPGCVSCGEDLEDAQRQAADALGLHIYGMEKDGEEVPAPAKKPEIDPETAEGYLVSPVTVYPDLVANEIDNRRVKTNITLPMWLKEEAEHENINLSRSLEAYLLDRLGLNPRPRQSL